MIAEPSLWGRALASGLARNGPLTSMPFDGSTIAIVTNSFRVLSVMLALAILALWSSSMWRIAWGRQQPRDGDRAPWVALAMSSMMFQLRWFWPQLDLTTKARLACVANGAMVLALIFAIYINGSRAGTLQLRRAILLHAGMLAVCIGATSILR